jgi:lipopolysaccharide heptosyltransferase II
MTQTAYIPPRDDYGYPTRPDSRRQLRNTTVRTSKRILAICIYIMMSLFGFLLRCQRLGQSRPPLKPLSFYPKRILVIRMDLIGDLVLSLTVVRRLKKTYPDAEIDLLALPSSAKVVAQDPDLAEIIPYDPNVWRRPQALLSLKNWRAALALRKHLQSREYDLAISVFGPWAAILSLLSGAPRRLGFTKESYPGILTDTVAGQHWNPRDHIHEVDYCLRLAQAAGAEITPADRIPTLSVSPQAQQDIATLFRQEGISENKRLIACHVTSNNGQAKRWPIPYWATLIDQLIREEDASVVFTGAPDDLPFIEAISKRMQEHAFHLAGKTSLTQLAALLQRTDLLITGDSGPMHIAAAVNTPLIAIHGPTDPALSGPVSPLATVVRNDIWCSPCYKAKGLPADCRFYTTQCMKNIMPAQVLSVVKTKLASQHHDTPGLRPQIITIAGGEQTYA